MKRAISAAVVVAALAGAFAVGWTANSGDSSPAKAASVNPSAQLAAALTGSTSDSTPNPTDIKARYENFVSAVAAKAGVSSSTLDQAIRSVVVSRIAAAVKAGTIKPAVATKIEQAIKDGDLNQLLAQRVQAMRARGVARPGLHLFLRLHHWLH